MRHLNLGGGAQNLHRARNAEYLDTEMEIRTRQHLLREILAKRTQVSDVAHGPLVSISTTDETSLVEMRIWCIKITLFLCPPP